MTVLETYSEDVQAAPKTKMSSETYFQFSFSTADPWA